MNPAPSNRCLESRSQEARGHRHRGCTLAAPRDHGIHQSGADADATRLLLDITALDPPTELGGVRPHSHGCGRQTHDGVLELPDIDGRVGGRRIHRGALPRA